MTKYLTVISSFVIMLCLGSVYAWSIIASELMNNYGFTAAQSQLVFGVLIAVFPSTMILAGKMEKRLGIRPIAMLSALFFSLGYIVSGLSQGNFPLILLGIGVIAGIGTGLGYLVALTTPVKWFPQKKGLVTGIAAAGFGLAALLFSLVANKMLDSGLSILHVFMAIGIVYGSVILLSTSFLKEPTAPQSRQRDVSYVFFKTPMFYLLAFGIFLGTFAGLLVIGSLKPLGAEYNIDNHILALGVSVFALANFAGRLVWGGISDYIGARITIFLSLAFQSISIFYIGHLDLNSSSYIILSAFTGFGFGGNFVLFAKKTGEYFGIDNIGIIYPYVFLGYAVAGILGPLTGGLIYDRYNSYDGATLIAAIISMIGAILFLFNHILSRHSRISGSWSP